MPAGHRAALVAARQRPAFAVQAAIGTPHHGAAFCHHVVAEAAAVRAPRCDLRMHLNARGAAQRAPPHHDVGEAVVCGDGQRAASVLHRRVTRFTGGGRGFETLAWRLPLLRVIVFSTR